MNRLKELRKEKGLSQVAFSKEIGIPLRTLQSWENGESQIKPDKAQILADHFEVEVGYLLGYEEIPDPLLDKITTDLNRQLTKDEKEELANHPELNDYYLGLAWERMLKNQTKEIEKQISAFDDDFINFLKYHDLYLSDSEIEKIINIIYSYSNANDFYLSSLVRSQNFGELQKQKENDFSKLFEYSTLWQMNFEGVKNQTNKS